MGIAAPVVVGLAAGITFLLIFAMFFGQDAKTLPAVATITLEPNQFQEQAVMLALQNSTLRNLFEEREPVMTFYRDRGVGHALYDCNPTCAIILFEDPVNPEKVSASVIVNPVLKKVFEVRASNNVILAKTGTIAEVKVFLSRYPDAEIAVSPGLGNSTVVYSIHSLTSVLTLILETTPDGRLIDMSAECHKRNAALTVIDNVHDFIQTTDCVEN